MTAGASRAEATITRQPALAPSPQPRPAPTARALIVRNVGRGGPYWMPIRGPFWTPIDMDAQGIPLGVELKAADVHKADPAHRQHPTDRSAARLAARFGTALPSIRSSVTSNPFSAGDAIIPTGGRAIASTGCSPRPAISSVCPCAGSNGSCCLAPGALSRSGGLPARLNDAPGNSSRTTTPPAT